MSFVYLPIEKIIPEENRFEPLSDKIFKKLTDSIEEHGIFEPIIVKKENNHYRLIQGHQRYAVANRLGIPMLPCRIIKDEKQVMAARYHVNLYRRHLKEEKIAEYEKKKEMEEKDIELQYKLIPELQYLEQILPAELKKMLSRVPEIEQRNFYNSLPVKYVEKAEEAVKEAEESEKKVEEITDKIKKKDEEISKLTEKIEKMEAEMKTLNLIKSAKKEELEKALKLEKKRIKEELEKEYSDNELAIKLQETEEKLKAEYEEKLKEEVVKETEEYRKIAERHSKEREELKRQLEPLQEEVKRLKKDLDMFKESEANAKEAEQHATENLKRLIREAKMPETLGLIVKELANIRGRILTYTDYLLRMGDVVHEEREANLRVIAQFKKELQNLNESARVIIDYMG